MDWDHLRYFLAAYRHRSVTGAARALRCDHTTVSRRLAALEAALGSTLFKRTPEGLTPTAIAEALAPQAQSAERAIAAIERQAGGDDERVDGVVRLTVPEAFAGFIIKRLPELRERYPELLVEVLPASRALDLARGEADLALRFTQTAQADVVVKKLCEVDGAMFASEAYVARRGTPAAPGALEGHELVDYGPALANVPGARWLAEHRGAATVVFRGNTLPSILDAAAAGLGLTVVPVALAEAQGLRRLSPEVLCTGVVTLAVHPDLASVGRVRAVMQFLEDVVRRDRAQLAGA